MSYTGRGLFRAVATNGEPVDFAVMRRGLYRVLLDSFEQEFVQRDALGVDLHGRDESDSTYRVPATWRARRIVEDPIP